MTRLLYTLLLVNLTSLVSLAQCDQVVRQTDQQASRVVVQSVSVGSNWIEPVQYKKVSEKGVTHFYVQLYALGGSATNQPGASVLFNDGTVLEWPKAEVKVDVKGTTSVSVCQIELTENEIEQFQEKGIDRLRLSTHERPLTTIQSQRAQDIINCVIYAEYFDVKVDKLVKQL